MKIGTYNVNGINSRLPVLLRWLEEAKPDMVCLQELKAPDEKFPIAAIKDAGYSAVWQGEKSWNGVAILSRGGEPLETRRGLPGDLKVSHSRYIEAAVDGVLIGCLYLPNGNPAPGPKWEYKLEWFDRFLKHAAGLLAQNIPVVLAGDFNVIPTDLDVYKPEKWYDDALFRPEVRERFQKLIDQGWTDAIRSLYPGERIYTFWDYMRNSYSRNAGLRLDHFVLSGEVARRLKNGQVDQDVREWDKSSDHAPVWIELSSPRASRKITHMAAEAKVNKCKTSARAASEELSPRPFGDPKPRHLVWVKNSSNKPANWIWKASSARVSAVAMRRVPAGIG